MSALGSYEHTLLSSLAYSDVFDDWQASGEKSLQNYIRKGLADPNSKLNNPCAEFTKDEWHAMLEAIADDSAFKGFSIADVKTNSVDDGNMIYLVNRETGEGCFVFQGTAGPDGWREDGLILGSGDTASQKEAVAWAKEIMDREEAAGHDYRYSSDGHSKGGNQATALAREDSRIDDAYSFDGPGDDLEHGMGDSRIHHINNEGDPVSALLFLMGDETLLHAHSDDPGHANGLFGAHSPSNLLNFHYDEHGKLVCTGPADIAEKGAWYRELIRTVSKTAGIQLGLGRNAMGYEVGLILQVVMDKNKGGFAKAAGVISILLSHKNISALLLVTLAAGVAIYGVTKIVEFGIKIVGKAFELLVDGFVALAQAIEYMGEQLKNAIVFAASAIASFAQKAWSTVCSWAEATVDLAKKAVKSVGNFFKKIGKAIGDFFRGGPKVYDFSSARLAELQAAYERMHRVDMLNPYDWSACYGGRPFMARLSLDNSMSSLKYAYDNERSVCDKGFAKTRDAFQRAESEDRRFARQISSMASSVSSAAALFA